MSQATKPLLHKCLVGIPAPLLKPSPVAQDSLGAAGGGAVGEGRRAGQINELCERDPISNNNQVRYLMLTSGLCTHMHVHAYTHMNTSTRTHTPYAHTNVHPPATTATIKENDKNYFFFSRI